MALQTLRNYGGKPTLLKANYDNVVSSTICRNSERSGVGCGGKIISTGVPFGMAAYVEVLYLMEDDAVKATIKRIGTLKNFVKAK